MPARSTFRFVHRTLSLVGPLASAACGGRMSGGAVAPIPNSSSLVTQETIPASAVSCVPVLSVVVVWVVRAARGGGPARGRALPPSFVVVPRWESGVGGAGGGATRAGGGEGVYTRGS